MDYAKQIEVIKAAREGKQIRMCMRRDPRKVWHMLEIRSTSSEVWFNFMDYVYEVVREPEVMYMLYHQGKCLSFSTLEGIKGVLSSEGMSCKIFRCEEVIE